MGDVGVDFWWTVAGHWCCVLWGLKGGVNAPLLCIECIFVFFVVVKCPSLSYAPLGGGREGGVLIFPEGRGAARSAGWQLVCITLKCRGGPHLGTLLIDMLSAPVLFVLFLLFILLPVVVVVVLVLLLVLVGVVFLFLVVWVPRRRR